MPVPKERRELIVTPEQLAQGWIELRGVTPIHHNFLVITRRDDGNYIVVAPSVEQEQR